MRSNDILFGTAFLFTRKDNFYENSGKTLVNSRYDASRKFNGLYNISIRQAPTTIQSIVTPSLSANSTSTSTIPGLPRAAPLSRTPAVSRADRHRARTAPKPAAVRPWPRGFAHRASRVAVPQRRSDVMWWSVMLRRHQDQVCTARRRRNAGAQGDPQLQASGVQGRRRC